MSKKLLSVVFDGFLIKAIEFYFSIELPLHDTWDSIGSRSNDDIKIWVLENCGQDIPNLFVFIGIKVGDLIVSVQKYHYFLSVQ